MRFVVNGTAVEVAVQPHRTLLEVLRYMPTPEVKMAFKAPERAATIEPFTKEGERPDYLCLVMPLRLLE